MRTKEHLSTSKSPNLNQQSAPYVNERCASTVVIYGIKISTAKKRSNMNFNNSSKTAGRKSKPAHHVA